MRDFILKTFTDDEAETCLRCNMQELVRCKDCKHAVAQDCEQVWCSFVDDGLAHEPNWFCADGEMKE